MYFYGVVPPHFELDFLQNCYANLSHAPNNITAMTSSYRMFHKIKKIIHFFFEPNDMDIMTSKFLIES